MFVPPATDWIEVDSILHISTVFRNKYGVKTEHPQVLKLSLTCPEKEKDFKHGQYEDFAEYAACCKGGRHVLSKRQSQRQRVIMHLL